ncbi:Fc.00g064130.m01.CDS01 [Cosmosporella sp. VM-42]
MGLLTNPLRSREQRLPLYQKIEAQTKDRYSHDDDYSSDDTYPDSSHPPSPGSSRNTSGSVNSGILTLPKTMPATPRRKSAYPYRLPAKVTRYLCCAVVGFIILMILSLVRASQVENWKVANGLVDHAPTPPPAWEGFRFLERYYGGVRNLVSLADNKPEYPSLKAEEALLKELKEAVEEEDDEAEEEAEEEEKEEEKEAQKADSPVKDAKKRNNQKRKPPASKDWNSYPGRNVEKGAQKCFLDTEGIVQAPSLQYYNGRPSGFPENVVGSYEVLNLPEDICFERFGRYGPYGFGYSRRNGGLGTGEHGESEGSAAVWETTPRVDFWKIDWADVQRRCFQTNAARFKQLPPKTPVPKGFFVDPKTTIQARDVDTEIKHNNETEIKVTEDGESGRIDAAKKEKKKNVRAKKERTAVVIRVWDEYLWREDDIANVRSIITELAMFSGGRYDIHLLVQVKDDTMYPIWADNDVYKKRIEDAIPLEFRGLVTLWTETQMLALYQGIYDHFTRGPDLPVHGVYRGLSMAMQYFAYMHPEYEYFWQWEMDVRYTGHYYDLFTKLEQWAKKQPRKGLWERNSRFYIPAVHGTWDDFSQMARVQSEMGTVNPDNVWKNIPGSNDKEPEKVTKNGKTVWGPERPANEEDWFEAQNDPMAPVAYDRDHYKWGVGEEADYISLNPIFDPDGTTWGLKDDVTGYNEEAGPIPRRANIITTSRLSRRLLMTMHKMTAFKKQFAFPEMWPATVALQHGYKAVYAPHPLYIDREWPLDYMSSVYNAGKDGSSGGARTSVFGDREHNLWGLTWFYNSGFAPNIYRRWLGLKVNNDGGEEFETTEDKSKQHGNGVGEMPGGEGRMCLPPMLLHPVKGVDLPIEAPPDEGNEVPETDPSA